MKTRTLLSLCLFSSILFSQTPISGIINEYAVVESIDYCEGKVSIVDPVNLEAGDFVLIIQMKGAIIDESNSSDFGNILEIGSAGLYEKAEVVGINGVDIYLKNYLMNEYALSGSVQIVTIPKYDNATVIDTLKGGNWDGQKGGIIAFEVENNLILNAPISASEIGFRGGTVNVLNSNCNFFTNANNYAYEFSNWRGAPKGEGIAATIPNKESGRGAQANGGGGGNDHNSGGGGGSNISLGGIGGEQDASGFGCQGNHPGQGGKALQNDINRIYLGGGGGAGHSNNVFEGKTGGSGGGIIMIFGNALNAQNQKIMANGESPIQSSSDGGAGGGAGGSIILNFETIINEPIIEATGGLGGSITSQSDRCFGPGGGGSGGRLLSNQTFSNIMLDGGEPGINIIVSNLCNGPSNEATSGSIGQFQTYDSIFQSQDKILDLSIMQQPENELVCIGNDAFFTCGILGNSLSFQWQINMGNGFEDLSNNTIFEGVHTKILKVIIDNFDLNNATFRCVISDDCDNELISKQGQLEILDSPIADFIFNKLDDFEIEFINLSLNSESIEWDFGDSTFSNENSPIHIYNSEGEYTVILTISNDCGTQVFSQNIMIGVPPVAQISSNINQGCIPTTIQFSDSSIGNDITAWHWEFPGGTPSNSNEQNPLIIYETSGLFDVILIVENQIGIDTITLVDYIQIEIFPTANFSVDIDELTVNFENTSLGGLDFSWDFGDGNQSNEENPQHTYDEPGVYEVRLTATSFACGSTIEQTIVVMPNSTKIEDSDNKISIYPNPTKNDLLIEFNEVIQNPIDLQFFDAKGLIIKELTILNNRKTTINLNEFTYGIYWLKISNGGQHFVKKIIVN